MGMIVANQVALDECDIEKGGMVTCSSRSQLRQCLYRLGYYYHNYYFVAVISITPMVAKSFKDARHVVELREVKILQQMVPPAKENTSNF